MTCKEKDKRGMKLHSRLNFVKLAPYVKTKIRLWPIRRNLLFGTAWRKKIGKGQLEVSELTDPEREDIVVVEVGANDGKDTEMFLQCFPTADIYCFEPDPRPAQKWRERVHNPRARLEEIAISDTEGPVTFHQSGGIPPGYSESDFPAGWDLSGSIVAPKNHTVIHPWSSFNTTITIPAKTLDSVLGDRLARETSLFPVTLLWADVQGAERQLIKGAQNTLLRTRYFYTEFSNEELYEGQLSLKELLSMLPNFRIEKIWTNDVLLVNRKAPKARARRK